MSNQITVDLDNSREIHIIGIGGAGMSAIAEVLAGKGHKVSGSDLSASEVTEKLKSRGIKVYVGHDASNISASCEIVTHSTAIPSDNSEMVEASSRDIPVLKRSEILAQITKVWKSLAVAGTHGKTTTSAMLTTALIGADMDPSYIVGGNIQALSRGAAVGQGEYLVVEADESDGTFLELDVYGQIITNVEPDHLEHYGDFTNLKKAFVRFINQAEGPKVVCLDDQGVSELIQQTDVVTYGTSENADWRIENVSSSIEGVNFQVTDQTSNKNYGLHIQQPGLHNARNATAAFVLAVLLGADPDKSVKALKEFDGVGRRFEKRGSVDGIFFVDDYAHLPTEVEAALSAAKSTKPQRLVTVFQPHRFSRTEQLWSSFGDSFTDADLLVVTGIYSSGEKPRPGITGDLISGLVMEKNPDSNVRYIEHLEDVVSFLVEELREGDLCMTLGAGDLTDVPDHVLKVLEGKN